MKLKYSLYYSYPLSLMIPYAFMVIDSDMYISDLSLKHFLKTYFNHHVI